MGGTVNVVSGTPFHSVTFDVGQSTFTLTGGDFTSMFNVGAIFTVFGTSTSNDGYYIVSSSIFTSGNTVVTVTSYSTGTSYPGTVPFVSSSTGTVLWFISGTPAPPQTIIHIDPSVNSSGGPLFSGEQNGFNDGNLSGGPPFYNFGSSCGSVGSNQFVSGVQVAAVLFEDGGGNFWNEVVLFGSQPQNLFSQVSFTSASSSLVETFTSASANYSVITGSNGTFTVWQWNAVSHYPFGFTSNFAITFTG